MAKKLWVGLGIGCGALVLIAVLAIGGGVYWMKAKFGGLAKSGQQMKAQKAQLAALDKQYPFEPPADGALLLNEARLQEYLAIRTDLIATYQKLEAQADALKEKKDKTSFNDAMKAAQALTLLQVDLEQRYIDGLNAHHMSPDEFQAITQVAFSEPDPKSPNAPLLTKYQTQLEQTRNPGVDGLLVAGNLGKMFGPEK